jgi:hypothetical protein
MRTRNQRPPTKSWSEGTFHFANQYPAMMLREEASMTVLTRFLCAALLLFSVGCSKDDDNGDTPLIVPAADMSVTADTGMTPVADAETNACTTQLELGDTCNVDANCCKRGTVCYDGTEDRLKNTCVRLCDAIAQ